MDGGRGRIHESFISEHQFICEKTNIIKRHIYPREIIVNNYFLCFLKNSICFKTLIK